jgi:hypothetical protein
MNYNSRPSHSFARFCAPPPKKNGSVLSVSAGAPGRGTCVLAGDDNDHADDVPSSTRNSLQRRRHTPRQGMLVSLHGKLSTVRMLYFECSFLEEEFFERKKNLFPPLTP